MILTGAAALEPAGSWTKLETARGDFDERLLQTWKREAFRPERVCVLSMQAWQVKSLEQAIQ